MDVTNISIKCFDDLLFFLFKLSNDVNKIIYKYYNYKNYNNNKCCECGKRFNNLKKCLLCNLYLCGDCHCNFYRNLY